MLSSHDSFLLKNRIDLGPKILKQRGGVAIFVRLVGRHPVPMIMGGTLPAAFPRRCCMRIVETYQARTPLVVQREAILQPMRALETFRYFPDDKPDDVLAFLISRERHSI